MPLGSHPVGILIYDANGYMSVQIMRSDDGKSPTATLGEVIRATPRNYISYGGPFEVDESDGSVIHHVVASLNPDWVGGVQKRMMKLEGDELRLSYVDDSGHENTLTWQRHASENGS